MHPSPETTRDSLPPPEDWTPLASYRSFPEADEHALVLLATGHDCWLHPQDGTFLLYVPASTESSARKEIASYENENNTPAPYPDELPPFRYQAIWSIHLWLISLLLCFIAQTADPSLAEQGLSSSLSLIQKHEWWRPFTALFLHSDFPHLLGNLLGAALFGSFVVRTIGPRLGLFTILASGVLGNSLNALFHFPEEHRSLGASTAVFGALGILAALGSLELLRHPHTLPWRRIIGPLLGGLILLGWMGGGSPTSQTDVGAHIAGFLSGLALVAIHSLFSKSRENPSPYLK